MNARAFAGHEGLAAAEAQLVDQLCDRFEAAWKGAAGPDQRPRIEDFLGETSEPVRLALLRELIALDMHYRRRAGETPREGDYRSRFPDIELATEQSVSTGPPSPPEVPCPPRETPASPMRYRTLRSHARGGLGEVSVALDEELHREVALKEIQADLAHDETNRRRFLLEAEITGNLEHPGIVPVYGLGRQPDGRPYYAMRFIQGTTLKEAIAQFHEADVPGRDPGERSLALRALLNRFVAVCNAIAYAHSRGIVHRDIKPGNIMLGKFGETLVVDWGLAKSVGRPESAKDLEEVSLRPKSINGVEPTQLGAAVGTPQYMSPEQAAGRVEEVGPASDIYSLGATLYSLLTGRVPVEGRNPAEVLRRVREGNWFPPRTVKRAVPLALDAVCRKAMALEPAERYSAAQALAGEVEHWLADEVVGAYREPMLTRAGRWARRHPKFLSAATTATLLVVVIGACAMVWLTRYWDEKSRRADQQRKGIEGAVTDVRRSQEQAHWEEAYASLRHAFDQLGDDGPADLADQLEHVRNDLDLVKRLDEIRLKRVMVVDGRRLDYATADQEYAVVFEERNLGKPGEDATKVAQRIQCSSVSRALVAALDDWADCIADRERRAWLLEVARRGDPDPWRDQARDPRLWQDPLAIGRLIREAPTLDWSPHLVAALSDQLKAEGREILLRAAQGRHPADFWVNYNLALALQERKRPHAAESFYRVAVALRPFASAVHNNLGNVLYDQGEREEAAKEYRRAIELEPKNAYSHNGLGNVLRDQGQREEAAREFRRAIELDPKYVHPHSGLGNISYDQGRGEEAAKEYRHAIELDPSFVWSHNNLGNVLYDQGQQEEAAKEYRRAIELDPALASPHNGLGNVLRDQGQQVEAAKEFRRAIELDPKFAWPHNNIGNVLYDQSQREQAAKEYCRAIELDPKNPYPHNGLGNVLRDQGQREEAAKEFRQAIELDPKFAGPHGNLGNVLHDSGQWNEAAKEYRRAIELDPKYSMAHSGLGNISYNQGQGEQAAKEYRLAIKLDPKFAYPHYGLGNVLRDQGQLEEATVEYAKALALGYQPAGGHLRQCERLLALTERLRSLIKGDDHPADANETLEFADLCQQPYQRRYAVAVRLYSEGFAAQPNLADDLKTGRRYNAACAAALTIAGQGVDAPNLNDKEKIQLRGQALEWLQSDLALWTNQAQSDKPPDRAEVQQSLRHWQRDTDLAGVRDPAALAKLPESEREAWQKLWQDVETLLVKLSDKK